MELALVAEGEAEHLQRLGAPRFVDPRRVTKQSHETLLNILDTMRELALVAEGEAEHLQRLGAPRFVDPRRVTKQSHETLLNILDTTWNLPLSQREKPSTCSG